MRDLVDRPPGSDLLLLPYDRLKTPETPFRATRVVLDEPIACSVAAGLGRDAQVASLLAASAALFYRYSGQAGIPVSLRVDGRGTARSSAVTIPANGSMTAAELLTATMVALDNQALAADPDAPVFLDISDGTGRRPPANRSSDLRADLRFEFDLRDAFATVSVTYNESLFTERTVTQLMQHLARTIAAMQNDPSVRIGTIDLFSADEHRWFAEHCRARAQPFEGRLIHEEIAAHASNVPDKVAVRFNDEHLTYAELNGRANQLARYLRKRGIGDEARIVVCLEPSPDIAVVVLGILKAGATYVPVNPAHPEFRIRMILEDTSPALVITQVRTTKLIGDFSAEVLEIDHPPAALADEAVTAPDVRIERQQVAYVYYTSGTTGQPKGVAATHANMIHFINVARNRYRITGQDVIPAVASFTFSISMFELMSPLSAGGTLLVLERPHVLDVQRMAATLQEVTLFHIGPSLLKNIVKYIKQYVPDHSVFANVRHASSGGDMVPVELLRDLRQIFTSSELYVIYGCSEISLMGCTWELPGGEIERSYVGKPFLNVELLVLDDDGNQVPVGAIGDVCFGGPGVVEGYVSLPAGTEDRFFVRDGTRYYRTGDRGRLNFHGELELLGRRDFQIKVRGMRVELAEIEYHLRQAEGVRDGLVASRQHTRGESVLVAYYVPESGRSIPREKLHAHMSARLPDYMVPVFYVALDALPLNYNLKVDRKALPELAAVVAPVTNPPVTETELAISGIWCALLQLDDVSLDDNFMLLGGDSLLAMEMIFLVQKELGYRLDGMDVLRESLCIVARIVDRETGRGREETDRKGVRLTRAIRDVSAFYFGPQDSLYGLYHPAVGAERLPPVLICPPIGYEYSRCQFLLHNLAERLADAGIPNLRFDFFGSGDSLGRTVEASFDRWRKDLATAFDELRQRTGCDRARVFCLRLTAVLALQTLPHEAIQHWVLWDPVVDGARHYGELRRMTREKVHKLLVKRNLRRPRRMPDSEELVGTRFNSEAIAAMKALRLNDGDLSPDIDVRQVLSADFRATEPAGSALDRTPGRFRRVETGSKTLWYQSTCVTRPITHKEILAGIDMELRAER